MLHSFLTLSKYIMLNTLFKSYEVGVTFILISHKKNLRHMLPEVSQLANGLTAG